jgi:Spy/CpxP family protein refolding chaperone
VKRPALLLAALAATTTIAFADSPQGPPPGGPPRGPPIERLTKDLGLDEAQATQVKQIFEAEHAKMESERAQFEARGTRPSREEMKAKHDEIDADLHQQLSAVLRAEQLAKFDELKKRQRPPGPPPGEQEGPPGETPAQ